MAAFSTYTSAKALDAMLNATNWTAPTNTYLALFTSSGGLANNTEGSQTEVSGGSYARVEVTFSFAAASAGACTSNADVNFATATDSWGTITHAAVMDASTSGNVLLWGALSDSKTIDAGDSVEFLSGEITFNVA